MTIAAGFVTHEGILLCADSQMTTHWDKTLERKVLSKPIRDKMVSFAFAGSADHARSTIEDCWEALERIASDATISDFRKSIGRITRRGFKDYLLNDGQAPEFLVGITTMSQTNPEAYLFLARQGAMPRVERCGFIGSGSLLAHHLMQSINPVIVDIGGLSGATVIALSVMAAAKRSDANCGRALQFLAQGFATSLQFGPGWVDLTAFPLDHYEYLVRNLFLSLAGQGDTEFEEHLRGFINELRNVRKQMLEPGSWVRTMLDHVNRVATEARKQGAVAP